MRKLLKRTIWAAGALAGLVLTAATVLYAASNSRLHRTYTVTPTPPAVPSDPAAIALGEHIAKTRGCTDCHGADLGGAKVVDDPAIGRLYGPNITRGVGGLPASYSDSDWVRAIRHGVAANGRPLFLMPSQEFAQLSDDDMGALLAYLKSVAPVDRARVPISVGPVARALVLGGKFAIAAEVIDHATVKPSTVKPGVNAAYGEYLAAGCVGCHGRNYSGGKIAGGPPDWPAAANLTPHTSARIATWSEADFFNALRSGRRPDGTEISTVMPRNFGQMTDTELGAIWMFLKGLPAASTGAR